jgi:methionine synthase II (cobalamin-independent)
MTDDLEALKEETQKGSRTTNAEMQQDLVDAIVEELEAIDQGESKTIAIRDESLSALFGAVEEHDSEQMDEMLQSLGDAAGKTPDNATKSELLRLAARVGLQTATPGAWDELVEAKKERAANDV